MDEFRLDENLKPHFKKPWRPGDPDPDPDAAGNLNEFMTVIPTGQDQREADEQLDRQGTDPKDRDRSDATGHQAAARHSWPWKLGWP